MKTSIELKSLSQRKLAGKYGTSVGVTLALLVCNLSLSVLVELMVPARTVPLFVASTAVVFLLDLLLGMLVSGRAYFYLNIIYDRRASFADLGEGFRVHPEKAMLLQLPFAAAATLMTTPIQYYQLFLAESQDRDALFVCLLLTAIGSAASILFGFWFSQVFFLLHDFPERQPVELLRASARLMQGHIAQYLGLLVHILLPLIAAVCMVSISMAIMPFLSGISFLLLAAPGLLIISQMYTAQAAFYQALTDRTARPLYHGRG